MSDAEAFDEQEIQKSLYVGHLHPKVTEEILSELFSKYGDLVSCKMFPETPGQDPYAFVEFKRLEDADHARCAMNEQKILEKIVVVRFATNKSNQKRDLSNDFHIFVGDLSQEVQASDLAKAFYEFGKITSVRIMKDPNTGKSKGFAFLSFQNKEEAARAIEDMNGEYIGNRPIRTNWASRKGPDGEITGKNSGYRQISYSEALGSSTATNTTVYFGNLPDNATDNDLREMVLKYGAVVDVKVFAEKRYAFVRMSSHEEAAMCISKLHGAPVREGFVKVFWGREYPGNAAAGAGTYKNYKSGGSHTTYREYVANYWNTYYQQYYQYMEPGAQQAPPQFGLYYGHQFDQPTTETEVHS